ncbi:MAG: hypothetical protein APF77_22320 [Clostridia bacterium BRH_c25]|nr:MAG: hypothetical protein APF77_22320 [Clostridia bacterium BRH_c25]
MWISKEGDVRKREFLDAALEIFYEKGYEKTTINDILAKVGVTKGSFYYYFKSKEDIFKELALQQAERIVSIVESICAGMETGAVEKFNSIIHEIYEIKIENISSAIKSNKMMTSEENSLLSGKIIENVMGRAKPLYTGLIKQGVDEGVFDTVYLEESAEMYIYLVNRLKESIMRMLVSNESKPMGFEDIGRNVLFYEDLINKMLGTKKARIDLSEPVLRYINTIK